MTTITEHTAWRFNQDGTPVYVESLRKDGEKGDLYSYTHNEQKALKLTERQCRDFCAYMRDCGTVGFWC